MYMLSVRLTINVKVIFRKDSWALVYWVSRTVKDTTHHVFRDGQLHGRTSEFDVRVDDIDAARAFKDLDNGLAAIDFEHLTFTSRAIVQCEPYNFT